MILFVMKTLGKMELHKGEEQSLILDTQNSSAEVVFRSCSYFGFPLVVLIRS